MRKCKSCQEEKEESEFYLQNGTPRLHCKKCVLNRQKEYCDGKKEERRAYNKEYRSRNKEKLKLNAALYFKENKDSIKKKAHEHYISNKGQYKERQKKYKTENEEKIKETRSRNREKYSKKVKENYQKNRAKRIEDRKKWGEKNKSKISEYKKKSYLKLKETNPSKYIMRGLRSTISRVGKGSKLKKSLEYIGVSSCQEFVELMSQKVNDQSWFINSQYHIDHIWQLNWCENFLQDCCKEDLEKILSVFNHHLNLRPLSERNNLIRSHYDFSPLKQEDFQKFEPYLNESIKFALLKYWENAHLFSGTQINKVSEEERIIVGWLKEFEP